MVINMAVGRHKDSSFSYLGATIALLLINNVFAKRLTCEFSDLATGTDDLPDYTRTIGDKAYICVHLLPWNRKYVIPVRVDENVVLTVKRPADAPLNLDAAIQLSNSDFASPLFVG